MEIFQIVYTNNMFRIIFYIILYIIGIVLRINSRNYNDNSSYYDTTNSYSENYIIKKFSRLRALKKCKNFLTKYKSSYKLENKFVVLTFNTQTKILRCYNRENRKNYITADWNKERTVTYNENLLDERFNYICETFNSGTTYFELSKEILDYFSTAVQTFEQPKIQAPEPNGVMPMVAQHKLLDINTATEKEITNLPGINIILAKKIIKYREVNMGFDSLNEFYSAMNIKPHFIKKLDNLIRVDEYKIPEKKNKSEDRIIDF